MKPSEEQEKNFVQGTLDVTVQSTDINVNRPGFSGDCFS